MSGKPIPIEDRFWEKVDEKGPDECWPWLASTNNGYGRISKEVASRVALRLARGEVFGPGECALHTCDNPGCCNPKHLYKGTHKDNSKDKISKGRFVKVFQKGTLNGNCVLSESNVVRIFWMCWHGMKQDEVADVFSVSQATVGFICLRERWKHVKIDNLDEREHENWFELIRFRDAGWI